MSAPHDIVGQLAYSANILGQLVFSAERIAREPERDYTIALLRPDMTSAGTLIFIPAGRSFDDYVADRELRAQARERRHEAEF